MFTVLVQAKEDNLLGAGTLIHVVVSHKFVDEPISSIAFDVNVVSDIPSRLSISIITGNPHVPVDSKHAAFIYKKINRAIRHDW
jgi:hypothetical protein